MNTSVMELSEEQRLFKDSVEKYLEKRYSFEQRGRYAACADGWSRAAWAQFADMGLLAFQLPEAHGGFAAGPLDTMSVLEAFGRALVLEPFLSTVVLGAGCIELAGRAEQQAALLPRIAQGDLLLAFAHTEAHARYDLAEVRCGAVSDEAGWTIEGEKFLVLDGAGADMLIVSAHIEGEGIALFLVDPREPGVRVTSYLTQDGHRAANIQLSGARVAKENRLDGCLDVKAVIEDVTDRAIVALCAEAVGIMSRMLDLTVEYLGTRQQFGTKIGSFQVLRHRAVDMLVALDQARSMTLGALAALAQGRPEERRKMASAAKAQVGKSARFVGQSAIQLHGGIGVTMEYMIGHCFLRSTAIEMLFGDTEYHLSRISDLGGLVCAADHGGMPDA